jgi:hypothetical protein
LAWAATGWDRFRLKKERLSKAIDREKKAGFMVWTPGHFLPLYRRKHCRTYRSGKAALKNLTLYTAESISNRELQIKQGVSKTSGQQTIFRIVNNP